MCTLYHLYLNYKLVYDYKIRLIPQFIEVKSSLFVVGC